jgi:hypothetical protein
MSTEQVREANQLQAARVPGANSVTMLDPDKPIVFRMRDMTNARWSLLCQARSGAIDYQLTNANERPLSIAFITGAVGHRPAIAHRGWQRHVADWLATSRQLIEDLDFDG